MIKLQKITIKHVSDNDPILDWIGEFTSEPNEKTKNEYQIVEHNGGSREHSYFVATNAENKKQALEDYNRMIDYNKGYWHMIGILAEAEIHHTEDGKNWLINKVTSGGLYGIESDSDDHHKKEVAQDQLIQLRALLVDMGISPKEFVEASKVAETIEE